jgi:hypothetical protein
VKRRIVLAATAVAAVSLALVVGIAPASGHGRTTPTSQVVTLTCNFRLTSVPKAGSTSVIPDDTSGTQYGRNGCTPDPKTAYPANFGQGVMSDSFTIADTGDTTGTYMQYFVSGALRGTFDLTPAEGGCGFTCANYTGTGTITSATGGYAGTTERTPAKLTCSSPDGVHYSCTETVRLAVPVKAAG